MNREFLDRCLDRCLDRWRVGITCHPDQELPPGWSWGPHWPNSNDDAEAGGRWAIHDESGRTVPVRLVPDRAFLHDLDKLAAYLEAVVAMQDSLPELVEVIDGRVFCGVTCHPEQKLPAGWSWGPRWANERAEGRYALNASGCAVAIRRVPDRAFLLEPAELTSVLESALAAQERLRAEFAADVEAAELEAALRARIGERAN